MEPRDEHCGDQRQREGVAEANHPVDETVEIHLDRVAEEADGRQPRNVQR